jgi:hypothetical protein
MHFVVKQVSSGQSSSASRAARTGTKTNSIMGHVTGAKDMRERFCGSGVVYPNMQQDSRIFRNKLEQIKPSQLLESIFVEKRLFGYQNLVRYTSNKNKK